jgi:hypothetical protein
MKVLSGRQPWWHAILHLGKLIENRRMVVSGKVRPPTWHAYRGPILLHASAGFGPRHEFHDAVEFIANIVAKDDEEKWCNFRDECLALSSVHANGVPGALWVPHSSGLLRGGIVGRARIVDVLQPCDSVPRPFRHDYAARGLDGRWHMRDQYGFVLADVEPLPFYPCKGALGLWNFDESLLAKGPA